jgi:hypothetical protein
MNYGVYIFGTAMFLWLMIAIVVILTKLDKIITLLEGMK